MDKNITKKKIDAVFAEVMSEMAEMLKSEGDLSKAIDDDAPAEESSGSEGPSAPPMDEGSAPPDEGSAPPMGEEAPPAEGSAPPMEGSAPPAPEGAPGEGQGDIAPAPTVEALQAEYGKLDPEALKMHYLACKAALMATMGQGAGPEASAPGAGAPPPAPPAGPPPGAAPMAMGEMKAGKQMPGSPGSGGKLGKSEDRLKIEALEKQLAGQNTALEGLAKAFDKITTPSRKSVKGISDLQYISRTAPEKAESVSLTKAEVKTRLCEKIREGKLTKSEKELVGQYTVGAVDFSKIEHLLAVGK